MEDVEKQIYRHCDFICDTFWQSIDLLREDTGYDELEAYLYDWGVVLGVLAVDVFQSVVVLLKANRVRGAHMLSRAITDYDVRLRYYIVQSTKIRRCHRERPNVPIEHLKKQMHAVRDWNNADFRLASVLSLYTPSVWPANIREELEKKIASNEMLEGADFTAMWRFLNEHEADYLGILRMLRDDLAFKHANVKPEWRMQSAFLHGDQTIISDVLEFGNGEKTGTMFKYSQASPYTILFAAMDHLLEIIQSFAIIRGWAPGAMSLRNRSGELWRQLKREETLKNADP
jgi:hypothetical protein